MVFRDKDYDYIIKEHFDLTDDHTRRVLCSINEADKQKVTSEAAAKLYKVISNKASQINYGDISLSKGDINIVNNFAVTVESLNLMNELLLESGEFKGKSPCDEINLLIQNMIDTKKIWTKGYELKSEIVTFTYMNIVMCIVAATSYLVSSCVEYTSNPSAKTFNLAMSIISTKKINESELFKNIDKLNEAFKNRQIQNAMNNILKARTGCIECGIDDRAENYLNEAIGAIFGTIKIGATVIVVLFTVLIPLMHYIVSWLYCTRQSFSNWLEIQSELISLNAEKERYDLSRNEEEREKIYKKQIKIAQKLKSLAQFFEVKCNKANTQAKDEMKDDEEKYKVDDVSSNYPDSGDLF